MINYFLKILNHQHTLWNMAAVGTTFYITNLFHIKYTLHML